MGVYIKGLEMPKNCGECFACKAELSQEKKVIYVCCFTREEYGFNGNRMDNCSLVPVPPHGRLIDADKLEKDINKYVGGEESRSRFNHWVQVQNTVIPKSEEAYT